MRKRTLEYQRDLYKLLLENGSNRPSLAAETVNQYLNLIVKITGASLGYMELRDKGGSLTWSTCHSSKNDVDEIRKVVSTGIVAEVLKSGRMVTTASAFIDSRFEKSESVRAQKIDAVLCVPICADKGMQGVLYIQGTEPFNINEHDDFMAEDMFLKHISPLLNQLPGVGPENQQKTKVFSGIIGQSSAFAEVKKEAMMISDLDVNVLLTGETGTGKSQIVKAIHGASRRRHGPFIHLNCAVLPEQLVESELFGAKKGSHSSAYTDMAGKISAANGGTLFLDEIGELPLPSQAKILQFLEEGFYYPLGAKQPVHPDVRIVAASNVDFDEMIKEGRFRADLFFRLNVFSIHMPSLLARSEDIPALASHFVDKHCRLLKLPYLEIRPQAVSALCDCTLPGNIRQLENMCQQAIVRAYGDSSSTLMPEHFIHNIEKIHVRASRHKRDTNIEQDFESASFQSERERWEKSFIVERLKLNGWNVSRTAAKIGLSRSHMNNLIKHHNLKEIKARSNYVV